MRPGFAADDGVALHFRGTLLERAVSSRPNARAYRVEPACESVVEVPLDVTYLDSDPTLTLSSAGEHAPGTAASATPAKSTSTAAPGALARRPISAAA